jgi:ubiquinone/menaquinone biosynthesis C-methylase UbiE
MADIYSSIAQQPQEVQERVLEVLRLRAEEPGMQKLTADYLSRLAIPDNARVLEIGCGSGRITRVIAGLRGVAEVVGIDPSYVLVKEARRFCGDLPNVHFEEGDARALRHDPGSFDLVISHTTLSHVPEAERALAEAFRLLGPGGQLVVFDGDYATTSMAIGDFDPVQVCVEALLHNYVNDRWFMRRLPRMAKAAGFEAPSMEGHGYVQIQDPQYLLTIIQRGAQAIVASGTIGPDLAAAIQREAERRVADGSFYGEIMFASFVARKPS